MKDFKSDTILLPLACSSFCTFSITLTDYPAIVIVNILNVNHIIILH